MVGAPPNTVPDARVPVLASMGALSGLLGVGFLLFGLLEVSAVHTLSERGVRTHGTVTAIVKNRSAASAEVTFYAKEGQIAVFNTSFQGTLREGDDVPIVYLPEHPKGAHVDLFQEMWGGCAIKLGVGAVLSIAAVVLFGLVRKISRR